MSVQTPVASITPGVDVRCPKCHAMLAKRLPSGALDVRRSGVRIAVIAVGAVVCRHCPDQYVKASYLRPDESEPLPDPSRWLSTALTKL